MKQYRRVAGVIALILAGLLFAYYWHRHPNLLSELKTISPKVILTVILLYIVMMVVLVAIYDITLKLCRTTIPIKEHALLTMYSSIANFFGPLQSGPGVRSVYLKQRHKVKLSSYASATLAYYLIFAGWSGIFLITGIRPWWLMALLMLAGGLIIWGLLMLFKRLTFIQKFVGRSSLKLLAGLALVTFVQVAVVSLIYFTELKSVNSQISFSQAIIYTGAANFALFVSLTPGALGFRESFLFFSQRLHHISVNNIVVANVIDRSAYLAFLGVVFLAILATHASHKFTAKPVGLE